jgi:glycosyltransferase involved in cell wall biosynthesis
MRSPSYPEQPFDISMVINFHHERILAHKTLLFCEKIRSYTISQGLRVEWVIVLDCGDSETLRIIKPFLKDLTDQFHAVSFGDAGPARNFGASQAKGKYVSFFDGDDFYSQNWLSAAYNMAESLEGNLILHPQYTVRFGTEHTILEQFDQGSPEAHTTNLLKKNLWPAANFTQRKTLELIPYQGIEHGSGFGYEDWHWNCETIAHHCLHKTVPDTALFYRVKQSGSRRQDDHLHSIIKPSRLFNQLGGYVHED